MVYSTDPCVQWTARSWHLDQSTLPKCDQWIQALYSQLIQCLRVIVFTSFSRDRPCPLSLGRRLIYVVLRSVVRLTGCGVPRLVLRWCRWPMPPTDRFPATLSFSFPLPSSAGADRSKLCKPSGAASPRPETEQQLPEIGPRAGPTRRVPPSERQGVKTEQRPLLLLDAIRDSRTLLAAPRWLAALSEVPALPPLCYSLAKRSAGFHGARSPLLTGGFTARAGTELEWSLVSSQTLFTTESEKVEEALQRFLPCNVCRELWAYSPWQITVLAFSTGHVVLRSGVGLHVAPNRQCAAPWRSPTRPQGKN